MSFASPLSRNVLCLVATSFLISAAVACADEPQKGSNPGVEAAIEKNFAAKASAPREEGAEVVAGPLQEKRQALLERIKAAGKAGIGISAYLGAFKALEDAVKAGAPEEQVQTRLDSLNRGLDDQMKRAQILKTQRPAPPMQSGGSTTPDERGGLANIKGGNAEAIVERLKEKYADKIPPGLDTKKILEDDRAKEILKKLGY
ncbi:MAG TPA: hypothetical protein V6D17_15800 [Candidatus Obscuribacterales bacterium]